MWRSLMITGLWMAGRPSPSCAESKRSWKHQRACSSKYEAGRPPGFSPWERRHPCRRVVFCANPPARCRRSQVRDLDSRAILEALALQERSQTQHKTCNWSLVIGDLVKSVAQSRLRQSPITSDQLPVTSDRRRVQSPNACLELEL